jgi:hypothetical protein
VAAALAGLGRVAAVVGAPVGAAIAAGPAAAAAAGRAGRAELAAAPEVGRQRDRGRQVGALADPHHHGHRAIDRRQRVVRKPDEAVAVDLAPRGGELEGRERQLAVAVLALGPAVEHLAGRWSPPRRRAAARRRPDRSDRARRRGAR